MTPLSLVAKRHHAKDAESLESVRRKAAAALGELLFYIVTQEQSSSRMKSNGSGGPKSQTSKWIIPDFTFKTVLRCLRPNEDPVVRHFCTQTFENILAQSHRGDVNSNFTSSDMASQLMKTISLDSKSGATSPSKNFGQMADLRATATSALSHLLCTTLRKNRKAGLAVLLEVVSTQSVATFCSGK
jgi:hypothetical protein